MNLRNYFPCVFTSQGVLISVAQEMLPGCRKVAVEMSDIFVNGTMKIIEVRV